MRLRIYKTLWGFEGSYDSAAHDALVEGFDGLEGPVPTDPYRLDRLLQALDDHGLEYIGEICTAGDYVPDRHADVEAHLRALEIGLPMAATAGARQVNCIGGCDAWPLEQSVEFFERAMELAALHQVKVSFETHRSRSLFNPWTTLSLLERLPQLPLTCDFSHWCVVCERLLDDEMNVLQAVADRARHIHARVGYAQGPQVPHPAAPAYAEALQAHQRWWEMIWERQLLRGQNETTLTPEFGPDGYLQCVPFTEEPMADLWEVNAWMANVERAHFQQFLDAYIPDTQSA